MDLQERIARRRSGRQHGGVIVDREQLSPVVHLAEPVGRVPVLERLLDTLEVVFDDELPPPVAVVGPPGSGTSAVVTAAFDALNEQLSGSNRAIATTTRGGRSEPATWFVAVDGRRVESAFAFYQAVLAGLSTERVPDGGVGTDELRERVRERLAPADRRAIVAIDHHDEPGTLGADRVRELLAPVADSVATVAVGQREPDGHRGPTVTVPSYRDHELVDVITERASSGLAAGAIDHDAVRELAAWADGNAHDALAALFGAAVLATEDDAERLEHRHLDVARAAVPEDGVHVGRPLALSATRQRALLALVDLDAGDRSISETATAIADRSSLTAGTVERFLYELADDGVLERIPLRSGDTGGGRQPSAVEPRFPTLAFRSLSTARKDGESVE